MLPVREEVPRGMKPRQFAKAYGMSDGAVYQGIRDGAIPHVRVNGRIIVLARQFEQMAQANTDDAD